LSKRLNNNKILVTLLVLLASCSAHAKGTFSKHVSAWKGITRYYAIYRPQSLAPNPAMVLFLNATSQNASTNPPYVYTQAWETLADEYGFVMVWPVSSYNPSNHSWYWDVYETDSTFPVVPDDSGFLRSLITTFQSQYNVSPDRTFVAGMSVYELHGDEDTEVTYCGGTGWFWGKLHDDQPSSDDDVSFWTSANSCTVRSTTQPLCTEGTPTPSVNSQIATGCTDGATVVFEREVGVGHTWVKGTEAKIWSFFRSHPRQ
jgi:poly(3-hydroxybutyrate) depolymerase